MPTYEFVCDQCNQTTDILMSVSEMEKRRDSMCCEDCGDPMRKKVSAPSIVTDSTYFAGRGTLDKQFNGDIPQLAFRAKTAARNGRKPNINDVYEPCLADFPGDPKAFVPADGGRSYVRRLVEAKGVPAEGAGISVRKSSMREPPPRVPVAKNILDRCEKGYRKATGDKKTSSAEIRHRIAQRHGLNRGKGIEY